jgi:phage gp29-like protein
VESASDDAADVEKADMIRDWLTRDELTDEIFDILDAVGKGVSFTEIIWDTSMGQWRPERLEWRDPRWFTFDRVDGTTPLLRGGLFTGDSPGSGLDAPLPGFKFIQHRVRAKSGLPVRSGLARLAVWAYMFKAYTLRDWAIFVQTYGQPVRIGRYHSGASEEDKATLFRAVANIAGDCAAIVPQAMEIEFVESKNVTAGSDLYEKRADWYDRQVSKAVLGQTTTTDAVSGGHAVAQEHRQVQEDIETADCKSLAAVINRDLVRSWIDLEFGPQRRYPRIRIARPSSEDLGLLAESLSKLVPIGLKVQASEVRDRFGFAEPEEGAEILAPSVPNPLQQIPPALQQQAAKTQPIPAAEAIGDAIARDTAPDMAAWMGKIEAMLAAAGDLDEFKVMLMTAFPALDAAGMAEKIALGLTAAHAAGRSELEDDSAD